MADPRAGQSFAFGSRNISPLIKLLKVSRKRVAVIRKLRQQQIKSLLKARLNGVEVLPARKVSMYFATVIPILPGHHDRFRWFANCNKRKSVQKFHRLTRQRLKLKRAALPPMNAKQSFYCVVFSTIDCVVTRDHIDQVTLSGCLAVRVITLKPERSEEVGQMVGKKCFIQPRSSEDCKLEPETYSRNNSLALHLAKAIVARDTAEQDMPAAISAVPSESLCFATKKSPATTNKKPREQAP
ncbi:MAG: hypothetical protein ACK46J_09560, partial [Burkholderiales bacterium]